MRLFLIVCLFETICHVTSNSFPNSNLDLDAQLKNIFDPQVCFCNPDELEELQKEINTIKSTVADLTQTLQTLHYDALCTVGIKDRRIPDTAMTASSYYADGYQAYYGRLDNTGEPRGFWHPADGQYNNQWLQVDLGSPTRVVGVITQGRPADFNQWTTSYKILYGNSTTNLVSIQNRESGEDIGVCVDNTFLVDVIHQQLTKFWKANDKVTNSDVVKTSKFCKTKTNEGMTSLSRRPDDVITINDLFQGNRDGKSKVTNMFPQPITARDFRLLTITYHSRPVIRLEYITC